jgi:hypothetical protein
VGAGIANVRHVMRPISVTVRVHPTGRVNRAYAGYETPGKVAPLIPWRTERVADAVTQRVS